MTKLTNNERKVLRNIARNDFANGDPEQACDGVWSDSINDGPEHDAPEGKALSGVVGSLAQKGLVRSDPFKGRNSCVYLTRAGVAMVEELGL